MAQNGLKVEDDSGEVYFIRFTGGMFGFSSEPYENMEGCDDDFTRGSRSCQSFYTVVRYSCGGFVGDVRFWRTKIEEFVRMP